MKLTKLIVVILSAMFLMSCSSNYSTPGGAVQLSNIGDADINKLLSTKPTAKFPTNIAIGRIQAPNYGSHYSTRSYGTGRYSLVTTKEVESEDDLKLLQAFPEIAGIAPLSSILLPTRLESIKDLRIAAARLKADILLVYTFDSTFNVNGEIFKPLQLISLGFLPNKKVTVTTTVSAALFDVRTEYLYGISEATAAESKISSYWSSDTDVDIMRFKAEKEAFHKLIPELETNWKNILRETKKYKK